MSSLPTDPVEEERRTAVGEELLLVVDRLIQQGEGFTAISVERLMAEAGLARSTFYAHFSDKADLLRVWARRAMRQTQETGTAWLALGRDLTREQLHDALREVLLGYRPYARLLSSVYDAAAFDPDLQREVDLVMSDYVTRLETHVRRGQEEGWVDPALPADQAAAWLTWMVERVEHQVLSHASDQEIEKLVRGMSDVTWHMLYAQALGAPASGPDRP